ncbi:MULTISPECIES: collagenase [Clostridium]|uniref:microbial collagenase n=2 Tax=Clostridium novyi TaxID=1542 RepID=Q84IL7_CLONO|nr:MULTISPECIES: collagenase [Clostridium]KEH89101.1 collagenase [Clostridium novyi A str. 4540]KEH93025.1 collagenase [Clostridium botulinum C/D str. It1]BAC57545.1 collagenase [Clostridium novyi]
MKRKMLKLMCNLIAVGLVSSSLSVNVLAVDNIQNNIVVSRENTINKKYSIGELEKLSNEKLIDTLSKIKWNDITDFMQYNDGARKFYSDYSRVQAIINAIKERGSQYTEENDKGIPTLIEVLRAGFYLGFYNKQLSDFDSIKYKERCIPAINSVINNSNFKLGTPCQNEIIKSVGLLISNTTCDEKIVNKLTPILVQYNSNVDENVKDYTKGQAIYNIIEGVSYSIESYLDKSNVKVDNTVWFKNIDGFINEVSKLSLINNITDDNEWLIDNGIYYSGRLAKAHSDMRVPQKTLEKALEVYPYLSDHYLKAVETIAYKFNGTKLDGSKIDLSNIKEEAKKKYTPKTYKFDNGSVVIKAGDKVSEEKIKRLYWASKEVKAQFHRVIGSDNPLEKGHPDDILNIVIYNNPKEYKVNTILYGYSTDNGGIYIENKGTFFTYERTEKDSIFSLEELFRHEFTHYLQGRYLVPGMWGVSDFYKGNNCRLTWFEEGSAEFFAGATRKDNILPRKSEVKGISWSPERRFSVTKLLHSQYGSFDFYNYGFAFNDYIYNNKKDILNNLVNYIKQNDVKGYESYIEKLSARENLNKKYQNHMQKLFENYDNLTTPLVSDDYLKEHPNKTSKEVYSDIEKTCNLKDIKISEEKGEFFNTFTLRGTYEKSTSNDEMQDWNDMNNLCNKFLNDLEKLNWSGYKTLTCYFVNHRVNKLGNLEYDIVFHGILKDEVHVTDNKKDPDTKSSKDVKEDGKTINERKSEVKNGSSFEDAIGPIKSNNILGTLKENYKQIYYFNIDKPTDIDINLENKSNEKIAWKVYSEENIDDCIGYPNINGKFLNGKIHVSKKGKYYLVVYKYSKETVDYNFKIDGLNDEEMVAESEPNNCFEQANKLKLGDTILGEVSKNDYMDIYTFNIKDKREVSINLSKLGSGEINWLVFSANDLTNYKFYALKNGNNMSNKFITEPGKYYISVYKISENGGKYSLSIK